MPTALAILGRLGVALSVLGAVAVLLFVATSVLPGDPVTAQLGLRATPELVAARAAQLGLARPLPERFADWALGLLTGDLGISYVSLRPVDIGEELVNSAILAGLAGTLVTVTALGIGLLTGSRAGSTMDRATTGVTLAAVALPEFVVAGLFVTIVGFGLGWFPPVSLVPFGGTPLDDPAILVLPVASLVVIGAWATRLVRAAVAEVAASPHVEAARLAGLSETRVLLRYLLPTAAAPVAQILAYVTGVGFGGTVVVERVFGYQGLGAALVNAVAARDTPTVQAVGMVSAAAIVSAFLVADLIGLLSDPRRRGAR